MVPRAKTFPVSLWLPLLVFGLGLEGLLFLFLTGPFPWDPVSLSLLALFPVLLAGTGLWGLVKNPLPAQSLLTLVFLLGAVSALGFGLSAALTPAPPEGFPWVLVLSAVVGAAALWWLGARLWGRTARAWLGLPEPGPPDWPWAPLGLLLSILGLAFLVRPWDPSAVLVLSAVLALMGSVPLLRGLSTGQFLTLSALPGPGAADLRRFSRDSFVILAPAGWLVLAAYGYPLLLGNLDRLAPGQVAQAVAAASATTVYLLGLGFWYLFRLLQAERQAGTGYNALDGLWGSAVSLLVLAAATTAFDGVLVGSASVGPGQPRGPVLGDLLALERFGPAAWARIPAVPLGLTLLGSLALALLRDRGRSGARLWETWSVTLILLGTLMGVLEFISLVRNLPGPGLREDGAVLGTPVLGQFALAALGGGLLQAVHFAANRAAVLKPWPWAPRPASLGTNAAACLLFLMLQVSAFFLEGGTPAHLVLPLVLVGTYVAYTAWRRRSAEQILAEKTHLLDVKIAENEALLLNILPEPIAVRLKAGEGRIADSFPSVSVLFADIVGFTQMSQTMNPEQVVVLLDDLFRTIDNEAGQIGIEKIKTIGDCYMAVAGLPEPCGDHADRALALGASILRIIDRHNQRNGTGLQIRVGINSGPVVAGVIGHHKYIYDLWGDAVNTASRMESHGTSGAIMFTEATRQALKRSWSFEDNGILEIKGKGPMQTWLLRG